MPEYGGGSGGDAPTELGSQIFGGPGPTLGGPSASSPGTHGAATWAPSGHGSSPVPTSGGRSGPISIDLPPGTIVGDAFRVDGALGAGGMGVVYRATHLKLDRPVALKLHAAGELDAARLEREARAMAKLSHPNVIGVFDVGTWRDAIGETHVFVAMEFCDAGTLRPFIAGRPDWRHALDICRQAGDGLAAAHGAGLVHRDFKPDNVLLSTDGRVRVADFGLARGHGLAADAGPPSTLAAGSTADLLAPSDQLTRTGAMVGTPAYMAPEQFGGGAVDARADQFAFCVVVYEALWGKRPFDGATAGELLYNVTMRGPMVPPRTQVPTRVWEVLRRGLDPNPGKRWASMRALLGALDRARSATGPGAGVLALALGGAVVVLGGGAATYLVLEPDSSDPNAPVADLDLEPEPEPEPQDAEPAPAMILEPTPALEAPPTLAIVEPPPPPPAADDPMARWDAVQKLGQANMLEDPIEAFKAVEEAQAKGAGDMALAFGLLQGMMPDPTKVAEPHAPAWDGTSTLECMHAHFRIEGKTIDVKEGPAFVVRAGCRLVVVDSTITAPLVVRGSSADHVEIVRSTVTATEGVVELNATGMLVLRELQMTQATTGPAVHVSNGKGEIIDSELKGAPGLSAGTHAKLRVEGGSIEGDPVAIRGTNCAVDLSGVEIAGTIVRVGPHTRIAEAPAPVPQQAQKP